MILCTGYRVLIPWLLLNPLRTLWRLKDVTWTSWRPSYPNLWWSLNMSLVKLTLCRPTYLNRVLVSIQTSTRSRWRNSSNSGCRRILLVRYIYGSRIQLLAVYPEKSQVWLVVSEFLRNHQLQFLASWLPWLQSYVLLYVGRRWKKWHQSFCERDQGCAGGQDQGDVRRYSQCHCEERMCQVPELRVAIWSKLYLPGIILLIFWKRLKNTLFQGVFSSHFMKTLKSDPNTLHILL